MHCILYRPTCTCILLQNNLGISEFAIRNLKKKLIQLTKEKAKQKSIPISCTVYVYIGRIYKLPVSSKIMIFIPDYSA